MRSLRRKDFLHVSFSPDLDYAHFLGAKVGTELSQEWLPCTAGHEDGHSRDISIPPPKASLPVN